VAGTAQAREAVIANQVPQTAAIKRSEAKLDLVYDGEPQFKPIEGTKLQYAANTPTPVIQVASNSYFAVENGVWFTGSSATGPWTAAASVPAEVYTIPPSSPVNYVTYSYVYGSTPDVVYVGYTPGYFGTVVNPQGTVAYGTGWVYPPWTGGLWLGRPWTYGWGVNFGWTPLGWGFGFTVAYGRPWWGPIGWHAGWGGDWWREGWHRGWGDRYAHAHINHFNFANANIYHRWDDSALYHTSGGAVAPHHGLNNVLAGPNGNVFRRGAEGAWEQHSARGWEPYGANQAAAAARLQAQNNINRLNAEWQGRRMGEMYTNSFHSTTGHYFAPAQPQFRPAPAPVGPAGFHGAAGGFRSFGGFHPGPGAVRGGAVRHR
jgi:hypothetical protein